MSKHTGVIIGVDDTDHVAFICPQCSQVMKVTSVQTSGVLRGVPTQNACTHIYLKCPCGHDHWRKFYWISMTAKYCTHRTDGVEAALREGVIQFVKDNEDGETPVGETVDRLKFLLDEA